MKIIDDVSELIGKGMNAADKRTQIWRLQSELSQTTKKKNELFEELGLTFFQKESENAEPASEYSELFDQITDLEKKESDLKDQIEQVKNAEPAKDKDADQEAASADEIGNLLITCSSCGSQVDIGSTFCPTCGNDLSSDKAGFKKCPNCNAYYAENVTFCGQCGTRLEDISVVADSDEAEAPKTEESEETEEA